MVGVIVVRRWRGHIVRVAQSWSNVATLVEAGESTVYGAPRTTRSEHSRVMDHARRIAERWPLRLAKVDIRTEATLNRPKSP